MQYFIAIRVINNMRTECLVVGRWRIQSISSPLPSSHIINHTLPTILKMIYNHCSLNVVVRHDDGRLVRSLCCRGVNNKRTYAGMLTAMLHVQVIETQTMVRWVEHTYLINTYATTCGPTWWWHYWVVLCYMLTINILYAGMITTMLCNVQVIETQTIVWWVEHIFINTYMQQLVQDMWHRIACIMIEKNNIDMSQTLWELVPMSHDCWNMWCVWFE